MQSKSILALAILSLACAPAQAADAAANLDLSGVTQVQVSGDASVIRLTASPGQEHRVTASGDGIGGSNGMVRALVAVELVLRRLPVADADVARRR